jgi:hypothetical protein
MGIWDEEVKLWYYAAMTIKMRDKLMAGVPRDPNIIEGWMRTKAGISSGTEEMRQALLTTLRELGIAVDEQMTFEELVDASEALAGVKSTNAFKRDETGLYIEGRQIKAAIKENVNILFAKQKWGKTGKGPRGYTAERVFVVEDRIHLGRKEPDGTDLIIGHVTGPAGPRSTLAYHEYVQGAELTFHIMEMRVDAEGRSLDPDHWKMLWVSAQENGIGALRSQGHGRFDVIHYQDVSREEAMTYLGRVAQGAMAEQGIAASSNGMVREVEVPATVD